MITAMSRAAVTLALLFSGLAALVYQVLWTRLLGFVFGTTSEAIGSVLAVFFAGMALGNWCAARRLSRVRRPLRIYGWLELGIGTWALLSLPILKSLPAIYGWVGGDPGPAATAALRGLTTATLLLPPAIAMGATLPVVARGVVGEDATLGRWSALLYAANTLGAVAGAYLSGFWLLPELGLTAAVCTAAAVNLGVAGAVLVFLGNVPAATPPDRTWTHAAEAGPQPERAAFLAFFAISGFVAIGYEIVWSKVFGIVMEGTIYGFSAVLSAYLAGIALGSAAIAPFVDRLRDLPRAFGLLHVGAGLAVTAGLLAVPYLPWAHGRLAAAAGGGDAVHLLFLLVIPIVLAPTALFGAAFPILIRIYTDRAEAVGEGMGRAVAVNTAGSIVASLAVGFWAIPSLGMDVTLHVLVLMDLLLGAVVLTAFQRTDGPGWLPSLGAAGVALVLVGIGYNGVHTEQAVAGREVEATKLAAYRRELAEKLDEQIFVTEGRNAIVTVTAEAGSRGLHTNGLPEAGVHLGPPYSPATTSLLGALPFLVVESPERALVIGLGAGSTVETLLRTPLPRVDVVELEEGVVRAMEVLHAGRTNPLSDPRVHLHLNDGRNVLLRARHGGVAGRGSELHGWDVIASQPSHPWLIGAANLFTEEFFSLARDGLRPGGAFALWVNGFRTDREALLAMMNSFERVFPGSWVVDVSENHGRSAFLLLGLRDPAPLAPADMAQRLQASGLEPHLAHHRLARLPAVLARFEGPTAAFARQAKGARNTDDNAFVETRIPRRLEWRSLDWARIEAGLSPDVPVLPPLTAPVDVAQVIRGVLDAVSTATRPEPLRKVERLLARHGDRLDPFDAARLHAEAQLFESASRAAGEAALRALGQANPERPEPWRILGTHQATRLRDFAAAGASFAEAFARSGDASDAYDAARAFDYVDPERAFGFVEKIPASERARFPRLAWYEAKHALHRSPKDASLAATFDTLRRYRDTAEGRRIHGINATLARLAYTLGDEPRARAYQEADRRERLERAEPLLERARQALAEGRLDEAATALGTAMVLLPGHTEGVHLAARLAVARGDRPGLEAALVELRAFAPSMEAAVVAENRFRAAHGLPLLSEQPAEAFAR